MAFSGALTLTDLNDFITPSQACIKPVEQMNKPKEQRERDVGVAATEIHIDESGSYYEVSRDGNNDTSVGRGKKLEQAQISLNDCLACSGCITSAESVLITLQSHTEVLSVLSNDEDERIPILSIAPQSLASLAAAYSSQHQSQRRQSMTTTTTNGTDKDDQLTPREILHRIREFCTSVLGFAYVFDTNFARHLALKEHVAEFLERKNQQQGRQHELTNGHTLPAPMNIEESLSLPMLTSACPGWICYAEKAHSEMLPFISRTKSPQQVMGTLVKNWIGKKLGKRPNEIYHVTVMPCYDKKLEASRQDFFDDIFQTRDVDCVVTTGELEMMMKEFEWDLRTGSLSPSNTMSIIIPVKKNLSLSNLPQIELPELLTHSGTSSGSYLHSIIHHLISTSEVPLTLNVKAIRNSTDYEEYVLWEPSSSLDSDGHHGNNGTPGKIIFKGIKCYGFRNLQNVVRKIGRERGVRVGSGAAGRLGTGKVSSAGGGGGKGKGSGVRRLRATRKVSEGHNQHLHGAGTEIEEEEKKFDYVEVMACPGGCVNGGGQLRPPSGGMGSNGTNENMDVEGYTRDWENEGGVVPSMSSKWGDKEWTKKVEEAYWRDGNTKNMRLGGGGGGSGEEDGHWDADQLVDEIVKEMCSGNDAERKKLFRTTYRAVESDVIGLAVKW